MHLTVMDEKAALQVAQEIVNSYAAFDKEQYFAKFAPECTFIFPGMPRIENRDEYEQMWAEWEHEGWRVISCTSTNQRVACAGNSAVFSHVVDTEIREGRESRSLHEIETIVLALVEGQVLAVHEHLSSL